MLSTLVVQALVAFGSAMRAPIEWWAPEACPQVDEFSAMVEHHLGMPISSGGEVILGASISEVAGVWVLDFQFGGGRAVEGESLTANDCWQLSDRAAKFVAIDMLALDQSAAAELLDVEAHIEIQRPRSPTSTNTPAARHEPEPEPKPNPESPDSLMLELASAEIRRSRGPPDVYGLLALSGGAAFRLFPNVIGALQLRTGLGLGRGRILAVAGFWPGGRFYRAARSGGAELLAWDVGVEGCGAPIQRNVELHVCVGIGGGRIRMHHWFGSLTDVVIGPGRWVWSRAQFQLSWVVRPEVALFSALGLGVSIYTPSFWLEPEKSHSKQLLYNVAPLVQLHAFVGVELRFTKRKEPRT